MIDWFLYISLIKLIFAHNFDKTHFAELKLDVSDTPFVDGTLLWDEIDLIVKESQRH